MFMSASELHAWVLVIYTFLARQFRLLGINRSAPPMLLEKKRNITWTFQRAVPFSSSTDKVMIFLVFLINSSSVESYLLYSLVIVLPKFSLTLAWEWYKDSCYWRTVPFMSRPVGEPSCRRTVLSTSSPVGGLSFRQSVLTANCPIGELSGRCTVCRLTVRLRTVRKRTVRVPLHARCFTIKPLYW